MSLRFSFAAIGLLAALLAAPARAEVTTISGFSFIGNHPTLGNVGLNSPGTAMSDDGLLGPASVDLKINFVGYATAADTLTIEDTIFTFGSGDIQFSLGPAIHLPENMGPISGGAIFAEITAASTTIVGLDVSNFVGGQFAFTYQNASIQPGLTQAGASGLLTLGAVASASFTFRVPEPSSILLSLFSAAALGLTVARRCRKPSADCER